MADDWVPTFDEQPILRYLSLPADCDPSPSKQPLPFLKSHLNHLPPQLLVPFSLLVNPRQRTSLVQIRNRRLGYATSAKGQTALSWVEARKQDPIAYENYMIRATGSTAPPVISEAREETRRRERAVRKGEEEGMDEMRWADTEFLGGEECGFKGLVGGGKLGRLLGQFEEEREADRLREMRREYRRQEDEREASLEEVEGSDDDSDEPTTGVPDLETPEQARSSFERVTREAFIDGLLEWMDYDPIDYDDSWDRDDGDDEERWFDDEEED